VKLPANLPLATLAIAAFVSCPSLSLASSQESLITQAAEPVPTQLTAQSSSQLNEENVGEVMAAIAQAESNKDTEALLKFLVPFAISEVTVESQGKSITASLEGIEAHRQLLEFTFKKVKKKEPINEHTTIRITPDGQLATVTRLIVEELVTDDGREFISSGTDIFRLAWIDGRPMVISAKTQGWLEERPAQK
jgi:hypothetical protein